MSRYYRGFDQDVLKVFFELNEHQLAQLMGKYKQDYGKSAATYARRTYFKWKSGEIVLSGRTVDRLLITLPQVLDRKVKCDLLRKLRERYRKKDTISLTVDPSGWRETIEPLVLNIVSKAYSADLPPVVQDRLSWLSTSDMKMAAAILAEAEVQEGKVAISLLHKEFASIENLLDSLPGKRKITHTISLPYGNVHLTIERGKNAMSEKDNIPNNRSLFRPTAKDIMDNALENLDPHQVKQISEDAIREALNIEAQRRRAEIKVDQARQDMDNFIDTADRMQRRGHDYKMSGSYETASGTTRVEVSKQNTTAIIVVCIVVALVALLIYLSKG